MEPWDVHERDEEFFATELDSFVPSDVFDAHAHLYPEGHWVAGSDATPLGPGEVGIAEYMRQIDAAMPGRTVRGLFFGDRYDEGYDVENDFVAAELSRARGNLGHMIAPPWLDPDELRAEVRRRGMRGLKVYHLFSTHQSTWESPIADFLPEQHLKVANEEGWSITLHIVRSRALADPMNRAWIRWAAQTFPNVSLILAHAARGYNPFHTVEGIDAIKGLQNVWFDLAAVTEALSIEAVFDVYGTDRLLWGSDYPVSHLRGRCVAIGDQFVWIDNTSVDFSTIAMHEPVQPYLVIHESLRVLKQVATRAKWSDAEVEAVFSTNARRLFGT